ncbi:MAG TPA: EAL domain-containing protein [Allosphingosinicella sp.]
MAGLCQEAGWRPLMAVHAEESADMFQASGAWVAIVDARDAMASAQRAVAALSSVTEKERSALLLILAPEDADQLPWFRRSGVTHFLFAPLLPRHFTESVNYAARYAEQLSGGRRRGLRGQQRPSRLFLDESKKTRRRKRLEIDLEPALALGEIHILFQPQVSIATGEVVGVEALARWRHGALGEVGAEALFDAAHHAGLMRTVSRYVQRKALEEVASWPLPLAGLRLSLNITAEDIMTPGFARDFLSLVDASGVRRDNVTVEVTESGLMENLDAAASLLSSLRAAGIHVAIDDFGTGYSSLAYLQALPLDYLKIDRKLSGDIVGSTRDRIVVRSVIDMARSLGLAVVAEGVESREQLDLLAAEGCSMSQGFLHSPPIPGAVLEEWLAAA